MYETALHAEARRRVREIGSADLVIGIPTYRNGRTIGRVMDAIVNGLVRDFPNARAVIMVADGGSSDNTVQLASDWPVPAGVKKIVTPYEGLLGRGSAVRAVFEVATALGARVCIILSPDVRDITPSWLSTLAAPILAEQSDLVLPTYDRPPLESALSDHIVYPMLNMLYGVQVRHCVGNDLAIRGDLAGQYALRDVWETDVARFGLDVWLGVVSMIEGRRIGQVCLGSKVEGMREFVVPMDPRFMHVVGTLFRLVNIYRRPWLEGSVPARLENYGAPQPGTALTPRATISLESIWEAALKGRNKYRNTWRSVLASDQLERLREVLHASPTPGCMPADLWARIVVDFAVVYNRGEGDPDKVVCALLPIYYARVVSYLLEMQSRSPADFEAGVQEQARVFSEQRNYLRARWDTYVPWLDESGH